MIFLVCGFFAGFAIVRASRNGYKRGYDRGFVDGKFLGRAEVIAERGGVLRVWMSPAKKYNA